MHIIVFGTVYELLIPGVIKCAFHESLVFVVVEFGYRAFDFCYFFIVFPDSFLLVCKGRADGGSEEFLCEPVDFFGIVGCCDSMIGYNTAFWSIVNFNASFPF